MEAGDLVVRIIQGGGFRTASLHRIERVEYGIVHLVGVSSEYSGRTLTELDPQIPGFVSYLAECDGGEEDFLVAPPKPDTPDVLARARAAREEGR